jgi:hypothetical protein
MPYALAAIDRALLAGMADGRILHSGDRGETWEETGGADRLGHGDRRRRCIAPACL